MRLQGLSQEDIGYLKESKDPKVKRAGEILDRISGDIELKMFASLSGVIERICSDLDNISGTDTLPVAMPKDDDIEGLISWRDATRHMISGLSILGDEKDSKVFERVNMLMKNYSDYLNAIDSGKKKMEARDLTEKAMKADSDFFSQKAKERAGNNSKEERKKGSIPMDSSAKI